MFNTHIHTSTYSMTVDNSLVEIVSANGLYTVQNFIVGLHIGYQSTYDQPQKHHLLMIYATDSMHALKLPAPCMSNMEWTTIFHSVRHGDQAGDGLVNFQYSYSYINL